MSNIKDRAGQLRRLQNDETFKGLMEEVRQQQIDLFLDSSATIIEIEKARAIVAALDSINRIIQSGLDAEAVYDAKAAK
jgi:hypothetical protein